MEKVLQSLTADQKQLIIKDIEENHLSLKDAAKKYSVQFKQPGLTKLVVSHLLREKDDARLQRKHKAKEIREKRIEKRISRVVSRKGEK